MISDGKIIFMALESTQQSRELVYQEYFSQRKTTFTLPEIVEQMEKAQDKVIRAHPEGSFLISGPAGSGKTTLALHRVAYLLQSPDTAEKFKENSIIVFVQDISTKKYFASLLPQLGINEVAITTFSDWARERLKLFEYGYVIRFGKTEAGKDLLEYQKYQAIKAAKKIKYNVNIFELLREAYTEFLSPELMELFEAQKKQRVLDRFDLTMLLQSFLHTYQTFFDEDTEFKQLKGGKVERKKISIPITYSLVVLDEVQNYLPEQIRIIRSTTRSQDRAIVYVGDLAQQTQLCTLRQWEQAGELFTDDRKAILQKNYRSTKQIMTYISQVGFDVSIPAGLRDGKVVSEKLVKSTQEEIQYVQNIIKNNSEVLIGVLAKTTSYLFPFKDAFSGLENVHVLTINEAQGVEFDIVCLVGINKELFAIPKEYESNLQNEKERVNNDLLYVALTRAMNELHVLGKNELKNIVTKNGPV